MQHTLPFILTLVFTYENKPGKRREDLGRKKEILHAFQWIINGIGLYRKLNREETTNVEGMLSFSILLQLGESKRKKENNHEEKNAMNEKSSCHW